MIILFMALVSILAALITVRAVKNDKKIRAIILDSDPDNIELFDGTNLVVDSPSIQRLMADPYMHGTLKALTERGEAKGVQEWESFFHSTQWFEDAECVHCADKEKTKQDAKRRESSQWNQYRIDEQEDEWRKQMYQSKLIIEQRQKEAEPYTSRCACILTSGWHVRTTQCPQRVEPIRGFSEGGIVDTHFSTCNCIYCIAKKHPGNFNRTIEMRANKRKHSPKCYSDIGLGCTCDYYWSR